MVCVQITSKIKLVDHNSQGKTLVFFAHEIFPFMVQLCGNPCSDHFLYDCYANIIDTKFKDVLHKSCSKYSESENLAVVKKLDLTGSTGWHAYNPTWIIKKLTILTVCARNCVNRSNFQRSVLLDSRRLVKQAQECLVNRG